MFNWINFRYPQQYTYTFCAVNERCTLWQGFSKLCS